MRGLIRFSDAPHQEHALDVLWEPLIYLANLAFTGWVYPVWRSARIQWKPDMAELVRLLRERSRPVICYGWHAYELICMCSFRDFPRDLAPMVIGHDGPRSRAVQQLSSWYGYRVWVYRRRSPIQPKVQLVDLLKAERPTIGLFPDAGGPDGQIRPGFVDVARAAEALLIPMAWHARPMLVVRSPRRNCFPVPFSRVTVYYGQPIDGILATRDDCRHALEDLERRMQELAATQQAGRPGASP